MDPEVSLLFQDMNEKLHSTHEKLHSMHEKLHTTQQMISKLMDVTKILQGEMRLMKRFVKFEMTRDEYYEVHSDT